MRSENYKDNTSEFFLGCTMNNYLLADAPKETAYYDEAWLHVAIVVTFKLFAETAQLGRILY